MTIGIIQIDEGKSISFRSSDGKLCRDWTKDSFSKQYFDAIVCVVKCNTLMIYDLAGRNFFFNRRKLLFKRRKLIGGMYP